MKDEPETDLHQRMTDFWEESIREQIRPGMVEIIEWHRAQGHVLALLTASSNYLSDLVASELNIPHVLCNRVEVEWFIDWLYVRTIMFWFREMIHAANVW